MYNYQRSDYISKASRPQDTVEVNNTVSTQGTYRSDQTTPKSIPTSITSLNTPKASNLPSQSTVKKFQLRKHYFPTAKLESSSLLESLNVNSTAIEKQHPGTVYP